MNINKELVGASTGLLILKILARGPNYGYEIVRSVNEAADNLYVWQEEPSIRFCASLKRKISCGPNGKKPITGG